MTQRLIKHKLITLTMSNDFVCLFFAYSDSSFTALALMLSYVNYLS